MVVLADVEDSAQLRQVGQNWDANDQRNEKSYSDVHWSAVRAIRKRSQIL
jgi:hypothetical protein